MKTLVFTCDFNDVQSEVEFYYGSPSPLRHPIHFQKWYISYFRGGLCPEKLLYFLENVFEKAKLNNLDFGELCYNELRVEYKPSMVQDKNKNQLDVSIETIISIMFRKIKSYIFFVPEIPDFHDRLYELYLKESKYSGAKSSKYYILGINAEKNGDLNKAIDYYRKADTDVRAVRKLALLDFNSSKEFEKKIKLILQSIVMGDCESIYRLAIGLDISSEYETFLNRLKRECEKDNENVISLMLTGIISLLFDHDSSELAVRCFEKATESKYAGSFYYLGLIYERGMGSFQPDIKKAIEYYKTAAGFNHLYSIHKLLEIYSCGSSSYPYARNKSLSGAEKIEKSLNDAFIYYEKAALFDDALAFMHLAFYYWHAPDDTFNPEKAKLFAEKALYCYDSDSVLNKLDRSSIADLYEILGNYCYYFQNKSEKCLEYFARAAKAGKPVEDLAIGICKYFKSVAKSSSGAKQRDYYENIISLCESLIATAESKVPYYLLAKVYARGLKRNLIRAKNYLSKSFEQNMRRVKNDTKNIDAPALYRLGKILDLNLLNKPNEDSFIYYQRATECIPKSFYSRLYKNKAAKKIEKSINRPRKIVSTLSDINYDISFNDDATDKPYVMLSFANENKDMAQKIQNAFETRGITALMDYRVNEEKVAADSILYSENAVMLIPCLSEYYEKSKYCQDELTYSIKTARKPIIPIIVQNNYKPKIWLEKLINDVQFYEAIDDKSLNKILPEITEVAKNAILNDSIKTPICLLS